MVVVVISTLVVDVKLLVSQVTITLVVTSNEVVNKVPKSVKYVEVDEVQTVEVGFVSVDVTVIESV